MLNVIKEFAAKHNGVAGICGAERLDAGRYKNFTPFVRADIETRVNPEKILPGVKSVIVTSFGHSVPVLKKETGEAESKKTAWVSSLGAGEDYHKKIKSLLRELITELQKKRDFKFKILVDSATLDERALAVRAGIGFFGRNGLVINDKLGSFFNIGCVLTDIPAEEFNGADIKYGSPASCPPGCRLCVDACPSKALSFNGRFEYCRCISYLTQKDGDLTEEEVKLIDGQLYGCDICRDVCPFNAKTRRVETPPVDVDEMLTMTDEELNTKIENTAMAWKGAGLLKRNASMSRRE